MNRVSKGKGYVIGGLLLTILFAYLALTVGDDRLANLFSDAFGSAFAVIIGVIILFGLAVWRGWLR